MGRTFLVLALANSALAGPADPQSAQVRAIDRIIEATLSIEAERGMYAFLMPYAKDAPFVQQPPRSLFVDGEIALMLAARRMVAERADYKELLEARIPMMEAAMRTSPVLCAESYPDECWTFCHSVALAAMRLADVLDGTDHSAFIREWIETAKQHLVDPKTGILVSSYHRDGRTKDGPEGSSIFMVAHNLLLLDRAFAADQYARAKEALGRSLFGFGWAREWPPGQEGTPDVDSGPIVPILDVSAGASGLAFVSAAAFKDKEWLGELLTTLELAGFPIRENGALRYAASNPLGDAVLLYALVEGPLWEKAR